MSRDKLKDELFSIVSGIVLGGGDDYGIGESLYEHMSMTRATECYWGTSGRGNPNAKARIRGAAALGYLKIVRVGRTEQVYHTQQGLDLYRSKEYEEERKMLEAYKANDTYTLQQLVKGQRQ